MVELAARRLWRHLSLAAAQFAALAAAIAVTLSVALVGTGAADAGLRSILASSPAISTVVIGRSDIRTRKDLDQLRAETVQRVAAEVGPALKPATVYGRLSGLSAISVNGRQAGGEPGVAPADAATFPDLPRHADLTAGAWPGARTQPSDPIPVAIRESGASLFGLAIGDIYCLEVASRAPPPYPNFCARVSGTWRPRDANDAYWQAGPSQFDLVMDEDEYTALASRLPGSTIAAAVFDAQPSLITAARAGDLAAGVRRLRTAYTVESQGFFITGLDAALDAFARRSMANTFTVQVVGAGLLLVAAYAVAFLAGHFLAAQEPSVALLRVRGWSRWRAWRLLALEFGLLLVPAVPLGVALAFVTSQAVVSGDRIGFDALPGLAAPLLAGVGLLAATLGALAVGASRRGVLEVRRAQSRPPAQPWWRWRQLDVALGLLSIPLLSEARLRGSLQVRSAAEGDPFGLVLPGLAIACLALVSLRLLPVVSRVCRLAPRNVSALLAWWRLSRQPGEHAGLAVLVSLAVAVGLFAGVYSTTERRNAEDRAAYAAGADLRAGFDAAAPPGHLAVAAASLPGVTHWTGVLNEQSYIGFNRSAATTLGVDEADFAATAWSRADVASTAALRTLAAADPDGFPLPAGATELRVSVVSPGIDAIMAAELVDMQGNRCVCPLGDLRTAGGFVLRTSVKTAGPGMRLRSLTLSALPGRRHTGNIGLGDVTAAAGGSSVEVASVTHVASWVMSGGYARPGTVPQPADGTLGAALVVPVDVTGGDVMLYPAPTHQRLPVLMSRQTSDALGLKVGYQVPLRIAEYEDTAVVVGLLDYLPTQYPGQDDFVVAPLAALRPRLAQAGLLIDKPNELWADTRGDGGAAAKILQADHLVTSIDSRAVRTAQTLGDPLLLELEANLRIGFAAALALAVVGFAVHFLIASRRRTVESAILRANGLPAGVVRRGLAVEQGVLLLFSVGVGAVLGGLLAYALLPVLELGGSVADQVPPTVLAFDPLALFLAAGAVLAAAFGLAWVAGRGTTAQALEQLRTLG